MTRFRNVGLLISYCLYTCRELRLHQLPTCWMDLLLDPHQTTARIPYGQLCSATWLWDLYSSHSRVLWIDAVRGGFLEPCSLWIEYYCQLPVRCKLSVTSSFMGYLWPKLPPEFLYRWTLLAQAYQLASWSPYMDDLFLSNCGEVLRHHYSCWWCRILNFLAFLPPVSCAFQVLTSFVSLFFRPGTPNDFSFSLTTQII